MLMGKRLQVALVVLLIAIVAGVGLAIFHHPEPDYRGHTLSYWLQQYNEVQDVRRFRQPDEAIRAIGTNALPHILSDLGRTDSELVRMVSRSASRHHWIKLPIYGENHYWAPALMALKALGSEATPVLPGLQKLLQDGRTTDDAAMGFFLIGPAAIPALEEACSNTNLAVRIKAATVIAKIKTRANVGVGYGWHKSPLNGKPVLYVGWAVLALPSEKVATPALIGLLANTNRDVARAAGEALKEVDPTEAAKSGLN